uniref:Ca-activated chloride channel family protein n=1 Tax=uncultured Thiotrichaceae bacterium TaxID=298394 RepID=A0A6S6UEP6_9GAMM|nr:MAG: Ca-activated chloride channel family protein [uncultured Thiotrichaceae bacterium]
MRNIMSGIGALVLCFSTTLAHAENERTILVLDASGSMWGQLEGKTKIEIARDALKTLVKDWPEDQEAGLVAYGHRKKGDCEDIETLIPVGPLDAAAMSETVDTLNPKGKTPLSAAVKQAAEALKYTEAKATVILLSDGKETCNMDPCALGTELEKLGVDFTAHVIGFDVTKQEDQAGLRCLAENTGGQFIPAGNAIELRAALEKTAKAPEPSTATKPEPESLPTAELSAPESAIKGTKLLIELTADEGLDGYIYLFPKGEGKHTAYGQVKADDIKGYKPSEIRLPATPGEFTLKWMTRNKKTIAERPLTITDAEISLDAPESAIKGTAIEVGLNAPEGLNGYIYLFPKGKDKHIAYGQIKAGDIKGYKPSKVRLPAISGEFTLKWITRDKKNIAEKPLTIEEAEVTLEAPESAIGGTSVQIGLNAPDGLKGYTYLFRKGKDKYIAYGHIKADDINGYKPSEIRLPTASGEYTFKWVTPDKRVIAEKAIIIETPEVSLGAPEQAEKGTNLPVSLNAPNGLNGYIYLFAKGAKKHTTYGHVREDDIKGYKPSRVKLPEQTGEYTLKWLTTGKELLAEQPLQIVDEITETVPDTEKPEE